MRMVWYSGSVQLALVAALSGSLVGALALPGWAQEQQANDAFSGLGTELNRQANQQGADWSLESEWAGAGIAQLNEFEQPATTITDWIAQIEASLVQITNVRVEATEAGLQVILETDSGSLEVSETRAVGNALIADMANATLAEDFSEANPIEGIALVNVTQLPGERVRVAITGTNAPPVAEITTADEGLAFAVTVGTATASEAEALELVVTGEQDEGYNPSRATTATRTDTPLRDIPQSITVVPRQVLEDRNVRNLNEAVETVSGVARGGGLYGNGSITYNRIIRGFDQGFSGVTSFRNGFPDTDFFSLLPIGTIEQIEVLRGPASVLFGAGEPGGIINVITRQPLDDPYYNAAFEAGNYGLYRPSIDLSGPLTEDDAVLYRFIASYQGSSDFQGFADSRLTTIAPSLTFNLGERTELDLYYEYTHLYANPSAAGTNTVILSDGSLPPRSFAPYYPGLSLLNVRVDRFGYSLEHELNEDWRIRNNVAISLTDFRNDVAGFPSTLEDDRLVGGFDASKDNYQRNNIFAQIDVIGEFATGSVAHQILAGFDSNRFSNEGNNLDVDSPLPPLDIRNPDYDIPSPGFSTRNTFSDFNLVRRSYGAYLQDQITLLDNLKLLIGGRYDWISTDLAVDLTTPGDVIDLPTRNDGAFSPRVGIVYQPNEDISLYASYTRSFAPLSGFDNTSTDADVIYEPSRGTQYEVGVKADFLDDRLSATLAAYHLTRTNVLTPDPDDPTRSVQTGEQRSQGIEFDVAGEILPGWNVILSYALTDAEVTKDNTFPEGNRLANVPENQASFWTTYTIQEGTLEGLGFGLGLFYIGERQGDLANSFQLDDYLRADAALYYRRGRFRGAINIRNLFDVDAAAYTFSKTLAQRTEPFTIVGSISWEF
ncbi:MAG: TonB-dependent siderophore receptor [Elainella sp. C42_A2020_010]|nr:TonB-dependent siderophore receptor [Elainella sp. C42_A2020_010]